MNTNQQEKIVDSKDGGAVSVERNVSSKLPSIETAGIIALEIIENVNPPLNDNDKTFFIAGFQECIKWLNNKSC